MNLQEFLSDRCGKQVTFKVDSSKFFPYELVIDGVETGVNPGWAVEMLDWRWDSESEIVVPELVTIMCEHFDSVVAGAF